ncbi:P-loop containing nucleoside triphosphate hydrolase protein [Phlebopus sp. FC_14]|nr:P-loop containing nucleoside triphosphate hydrolase protein [Phlebopus sp. FC_14]
MPNRSRSLDEPKNVVVFGESGVGKSSLINMVAGRSLAQTSSGVLGCTFQHTKYEVDIHDRRYVIWDTAGLDEGTQGTVPAEQAEANLKLLLRELIKANGIDLLIYCVRGFRIRKALLNNYNIFYSAICRKKVPIVVVVTGLENQEEEMEDWWIANEREFTELKMHFDGHACVTTLDANGVNSPALRQRCVDSRKTILSLITDTCSRDRWGTGWLKAALTDVKAIISSRTRTGCPPAPNVVIYDLPRNPSARSPTGGAVPFEGRLMGIGKNPLNVYRLQDQHLKSGHRFKKQITSRGADLLIFCAFQDANIAVSRLQLQTFYGSYEGDNRPLLVVVKGARTNEEARDWWNTCNDSSRTMRALVSALPLVSSLEAAGAVKTLQQRILTRSLQPLQMSTTGCFGGLFGRKRYSKLKSSNECTSADDDILSISAVWTPWANR